MVHHFDGHASINSEIRAGDKGVVGIAEEHTSAS